MTALSAFRVVGRAVALWPATLQILPEGLVDGAFERLFVAVCIQNASGQAWPVCQARISDAGRSTLGAHGIVVEDDWPSADASAFGQTADGPWVGLPALAAGASWLAFFKIEVSCAEACRIPLEIELRASGASNVTAQTTLEVTHSSYNAAGRCFECRASNGTVRVQADAVGVDLDSLVAAFSRVQALQLSQGSSEACGGADRELVRQSFNDFLAGRHDDLRGLVSDLGSFCAWLPPPPPSSGDPVPTPGLPPALSAYAVFSVSSSDLRDNTRFSGGKIGSNQYVELGVDTVVTGDVLCAGRMFMRERAHIEGDATLGSTLQHQNGTSISGRLQENASVAVVTMPGFSVSSGTDPVTVPNNASRDVAPGHYADLHAFSGSRLTLHSGIYHFRSFVLEPDVTLVEDLEAAPIQVFVSDGLSFGDRDRMVLSGVGTGAWVQFFSNQSSPLRIGTDIPAFTATVLAPRASIQVYSRTHIQGAVWGQSVTVEPNSSVALPTGAGAPTGSAAWSGTGTSGVGFSSYPTSARLDVFYDDPYSGTQGPRANGDVPWAALVSNLEIARSLVLPSSLVSELRLDADEGIVDDNGTTGLPQFTMDLFGATATVLSRPDLPAQMLHSADPARLGDAAWFANAVAWTKLLAGDDDAALAFGQQATSNNSTPTESETLDLQCGFSGPLLAGHRLSAPVGWSYQRHLSNATRSAETSGTRTLSPLLRARRVFTDAQAYASSAPIRLYAEIVSTVPTQAHVVVAHLAPWTSDRTAAAEVTRRLLRPCAREMRTATTLELIGFGAPAVPGAAAMPVEVDGLTLDASQDGTFATHASLPQGRYALRLAAQSVRCYLRPATQVDLDFERPANAPNPQVTATSTAGDQGGTASLRVAAANRVTVSVSWDEIVQVRLDGVSGWKLLSVKAKQTSIASPVPISCAVTLPAGDLAPGKWSVALFVQLLSNGAPASANLAEASMGRIAMVQDCVFEVQG